MKKQPIVLCLFAAILLFSAGCRDESPAGANADNPHASARGAEARGKPYVASVLREVYHRPDCRWAKKISERNLLGYDSAADAEADGRRPCRECQP